MDSNSVSPPKGLFQRSRPFKYPDPYTEGIQAELELCEYVGEPQKSVELLDGFKRLLPDNRDRLMLQIIHQRLSGK